jgi:hypothetical protein
MAARAAGPWRLLARRLARSTVAPPPAQRKVVEQGLLLVSLLDEHVIARQGGQRPVVAPPAVVESLSSPKWLECSPCTTWL